MLIIEMYNTMGRTKKRLKILEALLIGKKEPKNVQPERQEPQKFGAGQMKQIVLPIGTTLEETIARWRNVRAEAISEPEPTTADLSPCSYCISKNHADRSADHIAQQGLNPKLTLPQAREEADTSKMTSKELPSVLEREILIMHRRYEKAISTYSFQVLMKQKGFEIDRPSFYKIA